MFDTMTLTKITGALCGMFLIFLLGNWAAESLYSAGESHGDDHAMAYEIEVEDEGDHEEAEDEIDFDTILASADADAGAKVFGKCKACHKLDAGANGVGPTLFGVVGRDVAAVDGYGYSPVLVGLDGDWTPDALNGFLENPKGFAKGTKMSFSGLKKIKDRVNIIAYLQTIGG
jgi:cytochrome c